MDAPGGLGGCSASVLAYFGINSTRMPSSRPNHTSFYPQNTINVLLLCCKLLLYVETEVWRGSDFDPFWHPFCCFFWIGNAKQEGQTWLLLTVLSCDRKCAPQGKCCVWSCDCSADLWALTL